MGENGTQMIEVTTLIICVERLSNQSIGREGMPPFLYGFVLVVRGIG
jgi:hypothetical protein